MRETINPLQEEVLSTESPIAKNVARTTQVVLQHQLGLKVDMTGPGKVRFMQKDALKKEDLRQVASENELAREILERKIPLPPISKLTFKEGLKMKDQNGEYFAVSLEDVGGYFAYNHPDPDQNREWKCWASVYLYRTLIRMAVEDSVIPTEITRDPAMTGFLRNMMLDLIRSNAKGKSKKDILTLADDFEAKTADSSRLSVWGHGVAPEFRIDDKPVFTMHQGSEDVMLALQALVEPSFISSMSIRNNWFVPPERWEIAQGYNVRENSIKFLEDVKEDYPFLDIPTDPKEILRLISSSEFAKRLLFEVGRREGIEFSMSEKAQDLHQEQDEKQKKKKQSPSQIPQAKRFKKKSKAVEIMPAEESGVVELAQGQGISVPQVHFKLPGQEDQEGRNILAETEINPFPNIEELQTTDEISAERMEVLPDIDFKDENSAEQPIDLPVSYEELLQQDVRAIISAVIWDLDPEMKKRYFSSSKRNIKVKNKEE